MNSWRKVFGYLTAAIVFAGLATTANADQADERFTLTMTPANIASSTTSIKATIKNMVGDDDRIRSFKISAPAGVTIQSATFSPSVSGITVTPSSVTVAVSLLGKAQTVDVTMTVTINVASSCAAKALTWTAQAWGSINFSGEKFALDSVHSQPTTTISAVTCYTLTYSAGAGGSISGNSPQTVSSGGNGTLVTAVPTGHYHFVGWSDGVSTAGRTDTSVSSSINVSAIFAIDTFTLSYTADGNGSISGPTPQTVEYNASGTPVTAVPNPDYHFVKWSDNSTQNPRTDTSVSANVSVTANTARNTLSFSQLPPTNPALGMPFPVALTFDGPPPNVGVSGTNCTVTSDTPITGLTTVTLNVTINALTSVPVDPTSCKLNVSATDYKSPTPFAFANVAFTSNTCDLQTSQGTDYAKLDPNADLAFLVSNQWGVRRGPSLDNGLCTTPISYTFNLTGNISSLVVNKAPDSLGAAFKYVVTWPPVDVDQFVDQTSLTAGWSQRRPFVAWGISGTPQDGDFVPGLYCVIDPDDISTLTLVELDALLPTIPNVPPFSNFTATDHPQYMPNQKAKMCISQQGSTSFGNKTIGNPSTPIQIQYWDKIIDEGDGFTKMP